MSHTRDPSPRRSPRDRRAIRLIAVLLPLAIACDGSRSTSSLAASDAVDADDEAQGHDDASKPEDSTDAPDASEGLEAGPLEPAPSDDAQAAAQAASPDDDAGPPVSQFCGDAIRDPVLEECDDGPGDMPDVCSAACTVQEAWLIGEAGPLRAWGGGAHVLAAGADRGAAVYVAEDALERRVWVARFDAQGQPVAAPVEVSAGFKPAVRSDPAVAALPDGAFAIAWTDVSGVSPDIQLRKLDAQGALGAAESAHLSRLGPQEDVDLIWTGSELVAAWGVTGDVFFRVFDAELIADAPERALAASEGLESNVALTSFAGSFAAAWRATEGDLQTVRVAAGDVSWSVEPFLPAAIGERPALTTLDEQHLLLVFAVGADPSGLGESDVPKLRWAVLDVDQPGPVAAQPLVAAMAMVDPSLAASRPRAASVAGAPFLSWQQERASASGPASEVILRELAWDALTDELAVTREQTISAQPGELRAPALTASPLFPGGALWMAWESRRTEGMRAQPDLRHTLRPLPWLEQPEPRP